MDYSTDVRLNLVELILKYGFSPCLTPDLLCWASPGAGLRHLWSFKRSSCDSDAPAGLRTPRESDSVFYH